MIYNLYNLAKKLKLMKKLLSTIILFFISINSFSQDFQGKAFYKSKTTMDLGSWGSRMSAEQKSAMKDRMKPYLEKTFILTFNISKFDIVICFPPIRPAIFLPGKTRPGVVPAPKDP